MSKRIFIAGHKGMVGSAIVRALQAQSPEAELICRSHNELDLSCQADVNDFFAAECIDEVYLAAAHVGGIMANDTYPADFIYDNLMIEMNVIHAAWEHHVSKLLFLGSSCIYPRLAPQPIPEDALLTSSLETTNEAYALAKISGLKYCSYLKRQHGANFISLMPCNLYGPGDSYDLANSHVLPALIRRFHEAKVSGVNEVVLWGDGSALREFLHVDDVGRAAVYFMATYDGEQHLNIGSGEEISIKELAELVASIVGYEGRLAWDTTKPNGTPRKLMDVSRAHELGWHHSIELADGIAQAYEDFKLRFA